MGAHRARSAARHPVRWRAGDVQTPWIGGFLLGVSTDNDVVLTDGASTMITLFVPPGASEHQIGTGLIFAFQDPSSPRVWPLAVLAGPPPQ